ncbi:MAG TPA: GDP-mannose 4,6-dehydratase, partial [Bryobacteraceae bacterium]|nr:GDP-mannose 4,6-dehydratase [Bryobacteraceae bacterium]
MTHLRQDSAAIISQDPVLIVGGAGFIGTNLAARLLASGQRVLLYDNLSRPGVIRNLDWMRSEFGSLVDIEVDDIRDSKALSRCVRSCSAVYHFAAQTAVTTSVCDPRSD